uniref:Homeobox domain-containing protein n=1 Tax=Setaria italica TaxID=4555 RepID=K3YDL5_SETIT
MENDGHLNNNKEQALGLTLGDATAWDYPVEYDMDALLGEDHNVDTNQRTHDEDHLPESETPQSKRPKRFNVRQVQELEAMFHACTHPDAEQRQQLGTRIGLEERQVRFWFQNRRSLMKACGNEVKELQQENGKLQADNNELKQLMLDPTCFKCRDPAGATQTTLERQRLLRENARLKDELQRANAYLKRSIREAGRRPQPMSSENQASAYMNPVPFTCNRTNQATLRSHAERAFKELVMLATKGQPLWMPTIDGEVLNDQHYDLQTFPGLLGFCPWGFVAEATRETDMIKGEAMDLVSILTDVMDVEFWVQTPCLPTRNVKFLRFSKMMAERKWAVVDVSVDGNQHGYQQQSSGASCTGYRLLPSGCILEGMRSGFCKVTWVVHGEYLEAAVPTLFRKFLHSGQAFGACRWLRSFQRQCEYMAVLASSHVPSSSSSSSGAAISSLGKRGVLELAQRMTASFYAAISGPVTIASTNITNQWCVSSGTAAERVDAAVRMVIWNCAEIMPGEPAITVLSATTTVRLPGTPPVRVFEYLCNLQRRGEWDSFVNGGQVKELGYVSTSARLHGNAVSVLRPTIVAQGSRGMNNNMLILQQSSTDASGSLVVYSLIEENVMRGIMAGAENNIFLVPSGFAILPDGHGKARYNAASSSTSAPIDNNDDDGEGALLTVAFQAMLPSSPSGDHATTRAFDNAGQQLCDAIKKIKDAVGANNVIVN